MPAIASPAPKFTPRRAALVWLAGCAVGARAQAAPCAVAAASDLKFALTELVAQLEKRAPHRYALHFGSSGQFAQQIRQGLPMQLFMSADETYALALARDGLTQGDGARYATGRLALYVPTHSPIALDERLAGLRAQWGSVAKFAIANPLHAPYGRAAQEALQKLGLWELAQNKLVLGENIAQTTQFVATGAAQAGITARSLALAPEIARLGRHVVLPETLHAPLHQRMVLLRGAGPAAQALYAHLQTPQAVATLRNYGFD